MDKRAKALHSFLEDGEEWVDSWTVSAVGRGWRGATPGLTDDETVGLTDRRLLWLDENLESVALADVESVSAHVVDHTKAPWLVRAGGAALVFGVLGSVALLFVLSMPLVPGLVPLAVGLVVLLGAVGFARLRAREGEEYMRHRLQIDTKAGPVTVWAEAAVVEELGERLDEASDGADGDETDGSDFA